MKETQPLPSGSSSSRERAHRPFLEKHPANCWRTYCALPLGDSQSEGRGRQAGTAANEQACVESNPFTCWAWSGQFGGEEDRAGPRDTPTRTRDQPEVRPRLGGGGGSLPDWPRGTGSGCDMRWIRCAKQLLPLLL